MADRLLGHSEAIVGPTFQESSMLLKYRRRLRAVINIQKGGKLVPGTNCEWLRTDKADTGGVQPHEGWTLNGMAVNRSISAGECISVMDLAL